MSSLADAKSAPSWLKLMVLTGHSSLEKVLMQASSLASQTETRASAEPVAKYLTHLLNSMQLRPLVRKKRSLAMFHEISFTSNLNCLSAFTLYVLLSIKVTRSSLFPTAIVCPSGLQ